MALSELYEGRVTERDTNGITTTYTQSGTKAECEAWASNQTIGTTYAGYGKLASITISQLSGAIYTVAAKYQNANGESGSGETQVVPPNHEYGEFSATMDGQMLSTPLEIHKNASGNYDYLCNWNNYLLVRYPVGGTPPADAPAWWSTLGANSSTGVIGTIPSAYQDDYQWSESGTLPIEQGYVWFVLKNPTMPGFQSYDRALFTQTESARFRTYPLAVAAVASKLNKRGTPDYNPGSPFVAGNWKCDRATVSWTGDYWLATITWTYSPDGWNTTLYQSTT